MLLKHVIRVLEKMSAGPNGNNAGKAGVKKNSVINLRQGTLPHNVFYFTLNNDDMLIG